MEHSPSSHQISPRTRRRKRTIGRPSTKPILEKYNFTVEFLHPLIKTLANLLYYCNSFNHVSAFCVFFRLFLKFIQFNLYISCYLPRVVCCTMHLPFVNTDYYAAEWLTAFMLY